MLAMKVAMKFQTGWSVLSESGFTELADLQDYESFAGNRILSLAYYRNILLNIITFTEIFIVGGVTWVPRIHYTLSP